jgi:hypothetical protein
MESNNNSSKAIQDESLQAKPVKLNQKTMSFDEPNQDITNTNESLQTEFEKQSFSNEPRKVLIDDIPVDNLIIKQGIIDIDCMDPLYASKVMNLDLYKLVTFNSSNFIDMVGISLEIDKYDLMNSEEESKSDKKNIIKIKKEFIGDELDYSYEMLYVDLKDYPKYHKNEYKNELATILSYSGDTIYSNVIIVKNYLPSLSDTMTLHSVSKKDIERLLYNRVYNKIATFDSFDNYWKEETVSGDMELFAKKYFEDETFFKTEFGFLQHNINIWYTSDYGIHDVCGKLINDKIDKCIIFTMKSEDYRGNITIDEIHKIILLSNVLKDYNTPQQEKDDNYDEHGRRIINTRYKILNKMYHSIFNKQAILNK